MLTQIMPTVKLLNVTRDPLETIIYAYRTCRDSHNKSDTIVLENQVILGKLDEKLIISEIERNHTSPLEMIDFEFELNLSKVAHTHVIRHRISSFSGESHRAVKPSSYFVPTGISKNKNIEVKFIDHILETYKFYQYMIESGIDIDDARYILPEAFTGKLLFKENLRSLRNSISQRICKNALKEIQAIFKKIKQFIKQVHPILVHKIEGCYNCSNKSCRKCLED